MAYFQDKELRLTLKNHAGLVLATLILSLTSISVTAMDVNHFLRSLNSPDPNVRRKAVLGLGHMKDARAVQPLVKLLQDEDLAVSQAAAKVSGDIGVRRAVPLLIAALDDEYSRVSMAATAALGRIGDRRAVEPMIAILDRNQYEDGTGGVEDALGWFGGPEVEAALTRAMLKGNLTALKVLKDMGLSEPFFRGPGR